MSALSATVISLALASIWLGACLTVATVLFLRILPGLPAGWRYRIWVLVLGVTLTGPVVTLSFPGTVPPRQPEPVVVPDLEGSATGTRAESPAPPPEVRLRPSPAAASPGNVAVSPEPTRVASNIARSSRPLVVPPVAISVVGWVLLLGAVISLLRISLELRALGRLKRRARRPTDGLLCLWEEATGRLRSPRSVRVLVSPDLSLPAACGYVHPAVLVPERLGGLLTEEETRHLLLHELAHLVRRDDWGLLLERVVGALCWWHPVVRWVGRRMDQEREEACDSLAAQGEERRRYARTLVHLAEVSVGRSPGLTPGALRGQLTRRVQALLQAPGAHRRNVARRLPDVALAGAALLLVSRVSPPAIMPPPDEAGRSPLVAQESMVPIAALDSIFTAYADSGFSGTILLARQGTVLLEKGYGLADRERRIPATAETRYSTAGMTKLFTAVALLDLARDGKLDLQDSVGRWFPELGPAKGTVTVDQLLTYRDGLTRINAPVQRDDPEEFLRALATVPASSAPGAGYRYNDHGHSLLGLVIERVTGQEYESWIQRRYIEAAGLSHTGFEDEREPGTAVEYSGPADGLRPIGPRAYRWGRRASLGLVSTAGDLYRWFHALSDPAVVAPAIRDQLFQVRGPTDYGTGQAYGLELIARPNGHRLWRRVAGTPGFEGELLYDPDDDWTVVILVNSRLGWRYRVWREIERAMWPVPSAPTPPTT